jgi:hypothetical protein
MQQICSYKNNLQFAPEAAPFIKLEALKIPAASSGFLAMHLTLF